MIVFYVLLFLFHFANCARILGVQQIATHSHYVLMDSILKELAQRGHSVTMVSPFKEKTPVKNYKTILLSGVAEKIEGLLPNVVEAAQQFPLTRNFGYEMAGLHSSEDILKHQNVQKLLNSNETFDLVILEQIVNEAIRGFCYHYNAPCVTISTLVPGRWANPHLGNSGLPSVVPDLLVPYSNVMNFLQRLHNTVIYFLARLMSEIYFLPKQDELLKKYFPSAPSVYELMYNTSLLLVNTHYSVSFPSAYVPNMVEIGGYHITPTKPLPEDIKKFLDNANDGVIYFSMGSFLNTNLFPDIMKKQLLEVFSNVKQKVIFKWHNTSLENEHPNILIKNWLPQNDILAHRNVKLFVTHGGLLSATEAVCYGVPLLGIPIFGDQLINIANAVKAGYALNLPLMDFTGEKFKKALFEILHNPKYSINVQKRSKLYHDRLLKPLDTAIFWIEHVLKHGGADHLRTSALRLNWYQYFLLDVIAVLLVSFCIVVAIFCIVLRKIFCQPNNVPLNKKIN